MVASDLLARPLRNLRISVTDRCNLRCAYCMPEEEYRWLPRADILSFEEIEALARVFLGLGVERLRLTGGEPLLRHDLPRLVARLAALPGLKDFALTTNGVLLAGLAAELRAAGLHRITVSLDTLRDETFRSLTRRDDLARVQEGLAAAGRAFPAVKIDTVVIRGTNDDEIVPLLEHARALGAEIRFIEYMDVGGATQWSMDQVVPRPEVIARIAARFGRVAPVIEESSAPADRFRLEDGTVFGVISSTTAPFCRSCDRARLTADGRLFLCLYAKDGLDLRAPLRAGATPEELAARIAASWGARQDRGAEERLGLSARGALAQADALAQDPHLEMHTRGG